MSITNHLLAGSLIAYTLQNPYLAFPLAYLSHFALDAVPHYGYSGIHDFASAVQEAKKHKLAHAYSYITALTFMIILSLLFFNHNYLALMVGLVAVAPDAIMLLYYLFVERKGRAPKGLFAWINLKFHGKIQYERPWALTIEILTFILLGWLVAAQF